MQLYKNNRKFNTEKGFTPPHFSGWAKFLYPVSGVTKLNPDKPGSAKSGAGFIHSPTVGEGFTLLELVLGISLMVILLTVILEVLISLVRGSNNQLSVLGSSDDARRTSYALTNQLRNSEYASTGAYPLAQAGAQEIIFYANIDGGSDVERLRYFLSGTDLKRGVVKPTGSPLSYNLASEQVVTLVRFLANASNPIFYYYDGDYNGVTDTALAQPVSVSAVKHIGVSLKITNKAGQGTGTFTVRADATPRVLKDNLGE